MRESRDSSGAPGSVDIPPDQPDRLGGIAAQRIGPREREDLLVHRATADHYDHVVAEPLARHDLDGLLH